jgi:hypothetical protein
MWNGILSDFDAFSIVNSLMDEFVCIVLINNNMLPGLPPVDSSASKNLACALLSQGSSGLGGVETLIERVKLDLAKVPPDDAKEFVDGLLTNGSYGADYVLDLIGSRKLPKLESQDEVKTRASQFQELHSAFEHGIPRAFFGETSNVDDKF